MNEEQIFNKKFLTLDHNIISKEINKNGFFCCENALTSNFLNSINKDIRNILSYENMLEECYKIAKTK